MFAMNRFGGKYLIRDIIGALRDGERCADKFRFTEEIYCQHLFIERLGVTPKLTRRRQGGPKAPRKALILHDSRMRMRSRPRNSAFA